MAQDPFFYSSVLPHPDANAYFADLFEYDWDQVASKRARPESALGNTIRIVRTFALLTTPANELVARIHDRMPAILKPDLVAFCAQMPSYSELPQSN